MDKTILGIKPKTIKYETLLKRLQDNDIDVVGTKVTSDGMVEGIHSDRYVVDIQNKSFKTTLKLHLTDVERLKEFADLIEQTGFVYIDVDSLANQLAIGQGFLTAQVLKDMKQSENARVDVTHEFVNPNVEYQDFKIGNIEYRLYSIEESAIVYNDLTDEDIEVTHGVEILTSKKEYDGQTLLGRLATTEINKTGAIHLLDLLTGNTILSSEIGGAFYEHDDVRMNLFNINYKGMQVINNYGRVSVLSSNSFINLNANKLTGAKVVPKNENMNFDIIFYFGKKELTLSV